MSKSQHAAELDAVIAAVEKNSSFRQLATYSINILTKAATKDLGLLDIKATKAVVAALQKHPQSSEMLNCALECLMVLAEDPRQAVTLVECGGLNLSLGCALEIQDPTSTTKTLEHFEKIVGHARAASLLGSNEMVGLLGKLTTQCVHGKDFDSVVRCVGAVDQLTRSADNSENVSPEIVNAAFACLDALSKTKNKDYSSAIVTACKVAQRGSAAQQKNAHHRRQSDATTISRRRRRSTLNTRGSVGGRSSLSRGSLTAKSTLLGESPPIPTKKKQQRRLSMAAQGVSNQSLDTCLGVLQSLGDNDHVSSAIGELLLTLNHDSVETLLEAAAVEEGEGQEHALLILNAMATSVQGGEAIMWSANNTGAAPSSPTGGHGAEPEAEGDLGAQRLVNLLQSAARAEMEPSNDKVESVGQQRRTLTALSLVSKASRDPLSTQALFDADVGYILVNLLAFQLDKVPHLTQDLGGSHQADKGWGSDGVAERCLGILEVLVAMGTSNAKIVPLLPESLPRYVIAVLHSCRQAPVTSPSDEKLPLTRCATAATTMLRLLLLASKTDPISIVQEVGSESLLHDVLRVLTWHTPSSARLDVATLELECLECIAVLDEVSEGGGLNSLTKPLISCALSGVTATTLMRDQQGRLFFEYNNSNRAEQHAFLKKKIVDSEWLQHIFIRRKVISLSILKHHAESLKKDGMRILDALASSPRPWPWSCEEELFTNVTSLLQAIRTPSLSQSVITHAVNESKVKSTNEDPSRTMTASGVDLLDLMLLRPLPTCTWVPDKAFIKGAGEVLGEAGCRSVLRVLITEAERQEASWRRHEDAGVHANASAFVMMSAVSKFKKKAAVAQKKEASSPTPGHASDLHAAGTIWRLLILISIVPPLNPLDRICGSFVDVPEVESLVKVAAETILFSERKPSVEIAGAAFAALSSAASHPEHMYDDILPETWVSIAVAASKLLRSTDWKVVDAAALFLRQLALADMKVKDLKETEDENYGDVEDEFDDNFGESAFSSASSSLGLAVKDEGVTALVIQSMRKMLGGSLTEGDAKPSAAVSVSILESLLLLMFAASGSAQGVKTIRSKQPIDMLLNSIDIAESLELSAPLEFQKVAREATSHAESLLGRLVEDEDIASLLSDERERLENGGPSVPVKRLGILLELCARRTFMKRDTPSEKVTETKAAHLRVKTLKNARAGGVGLILDALAYAVEQGLDKASYDAIDTFVRTANCYMEPEAEVQNDEKSLSRMSSSNTMRFTIAIDIAKDILEVTKEEMGRAVGLIINALRTHAVSSLQGVTIATHALQVLSTNHHTAAVALAESIGKEGCLDSDVEDEEEEEDDDFGESDGDTRSVLRSLLPGLRLGHGTKSPQVILSCLFSLVNPGSKTEDLLFSESRKVIRGALREHTDKVLAVVMESVEGLDLGVDSNVHDADERFIVASEGLEVLMTLVSEPEEMSDSELEEALHMHDEEDLVKRLLKLASEQPAMLMLGVITDVSEVLLVVVEFASAACTLAEKTHSHLSSSLVQLVRTVLSLCVKMVDVHTIPIMFEVGLVARLINLVEYSRSLIRDLPVASKMVKLLHALCNDDAFLPELVDLAAVGSCLTLSSSHPQEVELTTLASDVVAKLSDIDGEENESIDSPSKDNKLSESVEDTDDGLGAIQEDEDEEEDEAEAKKKEEALKQQLKEEEEEVAKDAERRLIARQEAKERWEAENKEKREAKLASEAELAKIVADCSGALDSSLKELDTLSSMDGASVGLQPAQSVSMALDAYSAKHIRAVENELLKHAEPMPIERVQSVIEAVTVSTVDKEKVADEMVVSLLDNLEKPNEQEIQEAVSASIANVIQESGPVVSTVALQCLRQFTEKEEEKIDLSDFVEEELEDPEVYVEEEEITTGWEKIWSDDHEIYYYHNYDTEETVWEEPDEFEAQEAERSRIHESKVAKLKAQVRSEMEARQKDNREAEIEKRKLQSKETKEQKCVENTLALLDQSESGHSEAAKVLVQVLGQCSLDEDVCTVLATTIESARNAYDDLGNENCANEAALKKLTVGLTLASELSLLGLQEDIQKDTQNEILNLCDLTAARLQSNDKFDSTNDSPSVVQQATIEACSYALWRVAESGNSDVVDRTLKNLDQKALTVTSTSAVKRTQRALIDSGKIKELVKPIVEDEEEDFDAIYRDPVPLLTKTSRMSPKASSGTPKQASSASIAVTEAVSSVGSVGGAKSMTALIKLVTKDPSKVSEVVGLLVSSIETVLNQIDNSPKDHDPKDEFDELCRLAQLLHSLCSLSSVTDDQLATQQPHFGLVIQRGLQTSIRSALVTPEEQQRLVQTLLALLGRLTRIGDIRESWTEESDAQESEDTSTMMNTMTLDVLSETMEVPAITMMAQKALNNMVKHGGKTTVSVVKNHPVMSKMRRNSTASGSINVINSGSTKSTAKASNARRPSRIPQLPKRDELEIEPISPLISPVLSQHKKADSITEDTFAVLGQFAVSSIVTLVHSGDAQRVVESLMHISNPKTMLTTVIQLSDALLPFSEDGGHRISPQLALEMLLDISALLYAGGSSVDTAGVDEGSAFCGVPVLLMLLETSLSSCFEAVSNGEGIERDSTEGELAEVGLLVALATISTPKRLAPLVASLHLDSCHKVLQATAAHPAGLRALGSITQMLLEQLVAPPKSFISAISNNREINEYALAHSQELLADVDANISVCSILSSQLSIADAVETNAASRLERWRRTATLLKKASQDSKAHNTGAGRGLGAGDAFDDAFIATRFGKVSSLDFLMTTLTTARSFITGTNQDIKDLWATDFSRDVISTALALVQRRGGGKVGMKHGHVALGTLHELRHVGNDNLSVLAESLGHLLEESLSGAPELLLHELVRSIHAATTSESASSLADPLGTLVRCDELITAMGKGVDNILPSVGAMLLATAATGFQTLSVEEAEMRQCVAACMKLVRRLAQSRTQAKLFAHEIATSTNLALCLLNFLPQLVEDFEEEEEEEEEEEVVVEELEPNLGQASEASDGMVNWACSACTFENSVPQGATNLTCDICGTAYTPPAPKPTPTTKKAVRKVRPPPAVRQRAGTIMSHVDQALGRWFVSLLNEVLALSNVLTASPVFVSSLLSDLNAHETSTFERGQDMDSSDIAVSSKPSGIMVAGRAVCCLFDVLTDSVQRVRASMKDELVAANLLLISAVVIKGGSLQMTHTRKKQAAVELKALAKWKRKSQSMIASRKAAEADALQNELFGGPRASEALANVPIVPPMPPVATVEVEEGSWVEESVHLVQSAISLLCYHIGENRGTLIASTVTVVSEPMVSTPTLRANSSAASPSIIVTPSMVVSPSSSDIVMSDAKKNIDSNNVGHFLTLLRGLASLCSALLIECKDWSRFYRKELRSNLTHIMFGGDDNSANMLLLISRALVPIRSEEDSLEETSEMRNKRLKTAELAQRMLRRSALDTSLQLLDLLSDLSHNDLCIEMMLFGTANGGEGDVPVGDGAIVDLVVKLMISAPLWRIASMEEQRALCLFGLRCLDHFATIDNSMLDTAASKLLLQVSAPSAVIKVLRMQEASIAVQEAAVETLMSLAYSSAAVEVMLQKRCIPLLVSIAETYEDAAALVLCCLQTLTLLLQSGSPSAFEDFTSGKGIQLFLGILDNSREDHNASHEVMGEMKVACLNLLSTMSRSPDLCSGMALLPNAVPSIMSFLSRVLTAGGGDEEEEEDAIARLEQAVDALKHLSEHSDLNAAIGEHGMHLILQLVGTALNDRKLQLLYLDLIKHLSIHDSNVKALVSKDGITLLLWILESTCSKDIQRRMSTGEESERQLVKLQVIVLSTLGNMGAAHQEYAAVIVNAGAEKVLDAIQDQATKADHYEVSAAVRDVNGKLQQAVTWTRTKSSSITAKNKPYAPPPSGSSGRPPAPTETRPPPLPPAPRSVGPNPSPVSSEAIRSRPASMPEPMLHPSQRNLFDNTDPLPLTEEEEELKQRINASSKPIDPHVSKRRNSMNSNGDAPLMGYLRKQGGGTSMLGRKSWKTRFFVLDGPVLYYYESEEAHIDGKPLNAQPYVLSFCDVILDDANGIDQSKYYFTIRPCGSRGGSRPLSLEADSAATRGRWLTWLGNAQKIKAPGGL